MKIVIDIPEEEYRWIKQSDNTAVAALCSKECMLHAIKNGAPLPKGHGRLIDADMLEKKVEKHRKMLKISEYDRDLVLHYTDIEMSPTIIKAEGRK